MASGSYAYDVIRGSAVPVPQHVPEVQKNPAKKSRTHISVKPGVLSRICFVLIFAMLFTVVLRYTAINELNSDNRALERELQALVAANEQNTVTLDRATDLNNVEEIARTKLGMDLPQSHQVVNINLAMNDKAVKVSSEKNGFFTKCVGVLGACLEYLY